MSMQLAAAMIGPFTVVATKGGVMTVDEVAARIDELVKEEQAILRHEGEVGPTDADRERLLVIRIALDELWDLQRRMRARIQAGLDPESVELRDAARVEGYGS